MDARLPAHLEVSGLLRAVNAAGGFATVLAKGERDAGTILVLTCHNGGDQKLYERMPQLDGTRAWTPIREGDPENRFALGDYWERRKQQDSDLWVIELDIAHAERFILAEEG